MAENKLASNVYMESGLPYAATLASGPDVVVSPKGDAAALRSASKAALITAKEGTATLTGGSATTGKGLNLVRGAWLGARASMLATGVGLVGTGAIAGAVMTGGIGLLVGYLTYRGVKAFMR
jgi:hypothetical protein